MMKDKASNLIWFLALILFLPFVVLITILYEKKTGQELFIY